MAPKAAAPVVNASDNRWWSIFDILLWLNGKFISINNEDGRTPNMMETRHDLESNPVPTSISSFIAHHCPSVAKNGCGDRVRL